MSGIIDTIAGNGADRPGIEESIAAQSPLAGNLIVAADAKGNLFVAETARNHVWRVNLRSGRLESFVSVASHIGDIAEKDGGHQSITGMSTDGMGNVYMLDSGGRIWRADANTRAITRVAGKTRRY